MLRYADVLLFVATLPIICYLTTCCTISQVRNLVSAKLRQRKGYFVVALDDMAEDGSGRHVSFEGDADNGEWELAPESGPSNCVYDAETGALKPGVTPRQQQKWDKAQAKRASRKERRAKSNEKALHAMTRYSENRLKAAEAALELADKYAAIRRPDDDSAGIIQKQRERQQRAGGDAEEAGFLQDDIEDGSSVGAEVAAFLQEHRLGQHAAALAELGVSALEDLADLEETDLADAGLNRIERKRFEKAAAAAGLYDDDEEEEEEPPQPSPQREEEEEEKPWWEIDEKELRERDRHKAEAAGGPRRPTYLSHDPTSIPLCSDGGMCPCVTPDSPTSTADTDCCRCPHVPHS
eukprot:SAG22_NODE_431_length_10572_cov_70.070467_4_plen_351_part_00